MRKICSCFPLRVLKVEGIVLYPFVLFAPKNPSTQLLNHERIHVDQITRDGVWAFYTSYFRQYFSARVSGLTHDQAYRRISYEREAYEHQEDETYLVSPGLDRERLS